MPLVRQFITDDEVNADLARGSGFAGGKRRIYEYWQEPHSTQDRADFLKKEFGTGGHSHACSNATHSGQDHDAKGVRYSKSGCDQVQMPWLHVAQRIDALIKKGRYLTLEEEAERKAIEEAREDISEEFPEEEAREVFVAEPEHFIDHFYVAEDIETQGSLDIQEYSSLEEALRNYLELPSDKKKALGAMNNPSSPRKSGSGPLCDGQDTIIQDYAKVDGWQNPEVMDALAQLNRPSRKRQYRQFRQ